MVRYTQEKIDAVVSDAADIGIAAAAKKHKVSTQAIYGWRKRKLKTWSVSTGEGSPVVEKVADYLTHTASQENRLLRQLLAAREQEIAVLRECLASSNGALVSIVAK